MQKVFIFVMAMLMAAPQVVLTPTKAEAQVSVRPAPDARHHRHPGYGRPHHGRPHYGRPYYGRPHYGYDRRYYRRRNNDAAIAAGVAGLAVGAIAAGAINNNNRGYRGGSDHDAYCYSRYRSYDARTGTFVGYDGRRHYCRSPY